MTSFPLKDNTKVDPVEGEANGQDGSLAGGEQHPGGLQAPGMVGTGHV